MTGKLIIYTTPNCHACDTALTDLRAGGVDFEERSVMQRREWYEEVLKYGVTVPVLIHPDGNVEYGWKGEIGCAIF